MLYLIGLGLNVDGISSYGLETAKRCKKIYLENYTVDFPYSRKELQEFIGKKLIPADREFVESLEIVDEAKKMDVALLVYGNPLFSTTHITLIQESRASGIRCKVIHSASVFDAIAETGLQPYKFGKITSLPKHEANSFIEVIKENQKINAHSLILIDMGIELNEALERINKLKTDKIIVCQSLGTRHRKIYYDKIENLKNINIKKPYCIIIPSKLHFVEKEVLEG